MSAFSTEQAVYPRAFPARQPFSRGRVEGLFGITLGATYRRVRPFVRLRPGFVAIGDSPRPFACIRIFPPPLACTLADGRTLPALDVGGGDRMIRRRPFFGHDVRIAMGVGLRF